MCSTMLDTEVAEVVKSFLVEDMDVFVFHSLKTLTFYRVACWGKELWHPHV